MKNNTYVQPTAEFIAIAVEDICNLSMTAQDLPWGIDEDGDGIPDM